MATQETANRLTLGDKVPNFELPATDGTAYSPASFRSAKLLVIIFSSNHCPYVASWEDRMIAIGRAYADRGVAFALINSTDASGTPQDSVEEMRKRAEERGYPFPYLNDEDQSVARAFGAARTPEVFLFDQDRTLAYHGAIDSDFEESADMQNYLREALTSLLIGQRVIVSETPVVGCPIKFTS